MNERQRIYVEIRILHSYKKDFVGIHEYQEGDRLNKEAQPIDISERWKNNR